MQTIKQRTIQYNKEQYKLYDKIQYNMTQYNMMQYCKYDGKENKAQGCSIIQWYTTNCNVTQYVASQQNATKQNTIWDNKMQYTVR